MKITESIKNAVLSISVTAVTVGLVYIICPNGKLKPAVKYLLSLMVLLSVITPLFNVKIDIPEITEKSAVSENADGMFKAQAEYIAEKLLSSNKVRYEKMQIGTDISDDGNIFISSITVYGATDKEKAKILLKENVPYAEVTVYGNS